MNRDQVYEELTTLFLDVLSLDALSLNDATVASDVENWDSLNHINLIVAIEQKFKVSFTTREVKKLKNVGEIVDLVISKIN
ncbi:acyl carrier protein [Polynucleobacter sp. AP-Melu-500A-A1]|uniref:acyl carrier protein n=1 Tax=Polynucleobacter sp. AP-Melu-500A-A1 TaxID=2576929 RepID=UPI001C0DF92F|nr:acyl carrier protein [Polynucleobacter sp. AP-Melu-500A-A1]MBU3630072.1 acyl carrier protein [Polynucleobacter sp. AP-Melu-500A-A1]